MFAVSLYIYIRYKDIYITLQNSYKPYTLTYLGFIDHLNKQVCRTILTILTFKLKILE